MFTACDEVVLILADTTELDAQRIEAKQRVDELLAIMQQAIRENAQTAQDQTEYDLRFDHMTTRYQEAGNNLRDIEDRLLERNARRDVLLAYMEALKRQGTLAEFDEGLWNATVETVTVGSDGALVFRWKDGSETVCTK